jgi:pimeloyl-ACP methyl ester carboxylesterase
MRSRGASTGTLGAGLAYFRVGSGPPLVYLPGLANHHRPPEGMALWFQAGQVRPFARCREMWWLQRRQGLPSGASMADIAGDYADALRSRFDGPVDIAGSSTGGSVALQLAADCPHVVRRLVMLSSACRLGPGGREAQRRLAAALRLGRRRQAAAVMLGSVAAGSVSRGVLGVLGWILGPVMMRGADSDLVVTIEAEDAFDLTSRLPEITVPTMVVGGGRDPFYGPDEFRDTAAGLPNGRLLFHPGKGHVAAQSSRTAIREVLRFLAEG